MHSNIRNASGVWWPSNYPKGIMGPETDAEERALECMEEEGDRHFVEALNVHDQRHLIIGFAMHGRMFFPPRCHRDRFEHHVFPTCNGPDGWRTRFDNGELGCNEPGRLIFIYAEAEEIDGVWGITSLWGMDLKSYMREGYGYEKTYFHLPIPRDGVLNDDGLELVYAMLETDIQSPICAKPVVHDFEGIVVPDHVREIFRRAAEQVHQNFGQRSGIFRVKS